MRLYHTNYRIWTALAAGMLTVMGLAARPCAATDITLSPSFTQSYFHDLSGEVGLLVSDVQAAPAAPLGFPHFNVGLESSFTQIHSNAAYWQMAGNPPGIFPVPRLRATVGLPLGIDAGGSYAYVPSTNVRVAGGDVKWAIFPGGIMMPAVAIRGSYTALLGVSDLGLQTYGADLSISKGFAIFTPYLGVGEIWIKSRVTSSDPAIIALNLQPESIAKTRGFIGLQIGIPLVRFTIEAAFSSIPTYTARLSAGF